MLAKGKTASVGFRGTGDDSSISLAFASSGGGPSASMGSKGAINRNPRLRIVRMRYLLDDQGGLRKHMVVFVNGRAIRDRATLTDPVPEDGEVYVMQALSGG